MNECCKIADNKVQAKFKEALVTEEGFWYTAYICYCKECGTLVDSMCWIEL